MYTMVPFRAGRQISRNAMDFPFNDRFFRSFFNMDDMVGSAGFRVDVKDAGDAYHLEAELPGVPMEDINLNVENDVLTISADFNTEKKDNRESYLYSERRSGHLERAFNLEGIDQDAITAAYRDGILRVALPKLNPDQPKAARRIEIQK